MDQAQLEKWKEARQRARTDLYFLAKDILGYRDLVERVHRPICEFFVHKDCDKPFAEQDVVKQRLLLDPRGHFKTTIDVCDIVQWILNFPDIRILIMTGTEDLAARMLYEVKEQFWHNDRMRLLFPEYCVPAEQAEFGNTTEFTVPNRTKVLREPTVTISTIKSVKAGSHYDVIKCDDLVHENNIGTPDLIQKTIDAYCHTTPLLEPYGYRDVIGTRYDHSDLYGWIIDNNEGEYLVHARKCWVCKHDKKTPCTKTPDGSHGLLFGERFTESWLKKQFKDNPYIFSCQYFNDPTPLETNAITEALIESHTIPYQQLPKTGRVFVAWDLAFSQQEYSDYCVGAVGLYDDQGRLFVIDLDRGRYSPHELVLHIFNLVKKWHPARVGIEKAYGAEFIEPALLAFSRQHRIHLPLDWFKTNPKQKKKTKIAILEALLKQDKLYFASHLPEREEMVKEFVRFPRYKHDDIPDAIAMLVNYANAVDVQWADKDVEMGGVPPYVFEDDSVLGAGLVG
jgi:predicted phage terminase large subunit-like protein